MRTGLVYSFGLWLGVENELIPKHLTWMPAGGRSVSRSSVLRAPPWSWAALDGEIEFWDGQKDILPNSNWYQIVNRDYALTIKSLIHQPLSNLAGNSVILLEAPLKPATRTRMRNPDEPRERLVADAETCKLALWGFPRDFDCNKRSYAVIDLADISNSPPGPFHGWVCFDVDEDEPVEFYCLPIVWTVYLTAEKDTIYKSWRIMVLSKCDSSQGGYPNYRRVGYGEVFGFRWHESRDSTSETIILV